MQATTQIPNNYQDLRPHINQAVEAEMLKLVEDPTYDLRAFSRRFSDLVRIPYLESKSVVLIGLGGLGHPTFRTLINLGFKNITIIDPDVIDPENVQAQDQDFIELGQPKVQAMSDWALRHAGVRVTTYQKKVESYSDLKSLLTFVPDLLICTVDNMELRNEIYCDFKYLVEPSTGSINLELPELYIDMRMSAGSWTTFAFPMQRISKTVTYTNWFLYQVNDENSNVVFTDEEGIQEPCTARATNFTGYNAASYVGSFLAWWSHRPFRDAETWYAFTDLADTKSDFKYMKAFDSARWQAITQSPKEANLQKRFIENNNKLLMLEERDSLFSNIITYNKNGDYEIGDYIIFAAPDDYTYIGRLITPPEETPNVPAFGTERIWGVKSNNYFNYVREIDIVANTKAINVDAYTVTEPIFSNSATWRCANIDKVGDVIDLSEYDGEGYGFREIEKIKRPYMDEPVSVEIENIQYNINNPYCARDIKHTVFDYNEHTIKKRFYPAATLISRDRLSDQYFEDIKSGKLERGVIPAEYILDEPQDRGVLWYETIWGSIEENQEDEPTKEYVGNEGLDTLDELVNIERRLSQVEFENESTETNEEDTEQECTLIPNLEDIDFSSIAQKQYWTRGDLEIALFRILHDVGFWSGIGVWPPSIIYLEIIQYLHENHNVHVLGEHTPESTTTQSLTHIHANAKIKLDGDSEVFTVKGIIDNRRVLLNPDIVIPKDIISEVVDNGIPF